MVDNLRDALDAVLDVAITVSLSDGTVISPGELVPYVGDLDVNAILFNGPFHAIGGSTTRTFGGLLRRAIEVRDRVCQHPRPPSPNQARPATS